MNTGELIAGIVLIALSVLFYFSSRARKSQAAVIDSAPALNLNQPAQGRLYGKFQGVIVADQPIMTPYSSQPSVAWSAYLQREKREIDDDTSSTRTEWETVWSKSASAPFRLRGAGELWFDERGGLPPIDGRSTFNENIHDRDNPIIAPYVSTRGLLAKLSRPSFHAVETALLPGEQAFFVGPVEAVNGYWVARRGKGKEYSVVTWKSEQDVRRNVHGSGTLQVALSGILLVAGIIVLIMALS